MVVHFPCPSVGYEDLVAVGEGVFGLGSVEAAVGSMGHCMLLPGNIGLVTGVDVLDFAELVSDNHSYLGNHRVAAHFPILLDRSGHCPIARCLFDHNRNHSSSGHTAAGHDNHRSPGAVAASVVALTGRIVAAAGARSCRTAAGMPLRRCDRGGVAENNGDTALCMSRGLQASWQRRAKGGECSSFKCASAGALSKTGPGSACCRVRWLPVDVGKWLVVLVLARICRN